MTARERWRARLGLETGGPEWKLGGPPAPLTPQAELALLACRELRRALRVRPERDDPQATLIDRLTPDETLELLGPSWDKMSGAARDAYGSPNGGPEHVAPKVLSLGERGSEQLNGVQRWWARAAGRRV